MFDEAQSYYNYRKNQHIISLMQKVHGFGLYELSQTGVEELPEFKAISRPNTGQIARDGHNGSGWQNLVAAEFLNMHFNTAI